MKPLHRALAVAALGATATMIVSAGCGNEPEPYPWPKGGPNLNGNPSGGSGSPPPLDLCECAATFGLDPLSTNPDSCSSCVNDTQAVASDPCAAPAQACLGDPGCNAITDCLAKCTDPACTAACIVPLDKDAAHQLYQAFLACACPLCDAKCHYTKPLTCDTLDDGADAGADGGDGGP